MNTKALHPNTLTLLSAWERISAAPGDKSLGPRTSQHPDIIECLFVIERRSEGVWSFRNVGERMSNLLGRDLAEHDYLNFWTGHDREMITAFLAGVHESRQPGIVRANGETLTGERIDIEMTLAPLHSSKARPGCQRLLGLYQTLHGADVLKGRPVWRHRVTAIFPPDMRAEPPRLRLVTSND